MKVIYEVTSNGTAILLDLLTRPVAFLHRPNKK